MSRKQDAISLATLARLQQLAVLGSRKAVEQAIVETDQRVTAHDAAERQLASAEKYYDELHSKGAFCPVRMQVVGAIVTKASDHLDAEARHLLEARDCETVATTKWQHDEHRAEWFADEARIAARRNQRLNDAKIEDEVRGLRIALGGETRP